MNYWSRHWQSLFDIKQEDTPENNMFFQRRWEDVTEDDINEMASRLENELGGWIFHEPVDFSKPTPHITTTVGHPSLIAEWFNS